MKHVIVGTAGHIDHGKTELVRALTGVNCDRLGEEQARGITIDIGFAPLKLGDDLALGFIDVPGHERFVKNMLAGASGIDMVVLVVAADESIKPQTREHFEICKLLDVQAGLVALTKIDLADAEVRELVTLEIRDLIQGSFLEGAPVVPVSARTGEGLEGLRESLGTEALKARPRSMSAFLRLPVDRSFSIKGFGTVVTGTLAAGKVAEGSEVSVYPAGIKARVRGLQVHGAGVAEAVAGQRTAVNLQGLDAAQAPRGSVLAPPGAMRPSSLADVKLTLLAEAPAELKSLDRVRFHHGTSEMLARVKLMGRNRLEPGESCFAQLRLETPGLALPGDRFVLRRYSPMVTIGGGVILDGHPPKHRGSGARQVADLEALEGGGVPAVALHALKGRPDGVTLEEMIVRTGRTPAEVERVFERIEDAGDAVGVGDRPGSRLHADWVRKHQARAVEILARFHEKNPLMMGFPREELLQKLVPGGRPEAVRFVLDGLVKAGRIRFEKDLVALEEHRVALRPEEEEAMARIEAAFREGGLNPGSLDDIVKGGRLDAPTSQRIYHLLISRGRLVKIRDGKVFHAESLERLKESLWKLRETKPVIDVAEFKELTGTSRKNAIPLLEHLDAEKVTRRKGNDREILSPQGGSTA